MSTPSSSFHLTGWHHYPCVNKGTNNMKLCKWKVLVQRGKVRRYADSTSSWREWWDRKPVKVHSCTYSANVQGLWLAMFWSRIWVWKGKKKNHVSSLGESVGGSKQIKKNHMKSILKAVTEKECGICISWVGSKKGSRENSSRFENWQNRRSLLEEQRKGKSFKQCEQNTYGIGPWEKGAHPEA